MRLFSAVTTKLSILLVVFSISFSNSAYSILPDLTATKDERSLSNPSYVVGQHWFRKLNGSASVIDFPPAYDYLKGALSRILPQTSLYNKMIEMTLLNSTQTNAFVIPGNHLFIYSDIMEIITSEDTFYGLLAHEVSHLDLNHYERQTQHAGEEFHKNLLLIGAGFAAALAGADPDASAALWMGGMANQVDGLLSYSRTQEQEADRHGRQYLVDAGLDPKGMNTLFSALAKASSHRPQLEFLSSHPLPQTRMADSLSTSSPKSILETRNHSDFDYFRATLLTYRAMLADDPYHYLASIFPDSQSDVGHYAKALLHYLDQSPDQALNSLSKVNHSNRFIDYLRVKSFAANNQQSNALAILKAKLSLAPKDIVFSTLYAELTNKKPETLKTPYLYQKKQMWEAYMNYYQGISNIPMALNYKALYEFSQGKDKQAENLISRAYRDISLQDKEIVKKTEEYFERIKEVEKRQDIK
ncbi:M48 family metallopeptidase [Marinomonas pollencensis]|uniref:Putative Zn-dependent protease n=1 Tax=Marinomonas pollencensis TaxID=491954 RepID=A0A3E0DRU5_9GAMM|nr:M48 family metalloprotease [Marinomonas pollencensis]REG85831.1 putative Zn-dependent protease [Marinomonas pollencensis]